MSDEPATARSLEPAGQLDPAEIRAELDKITASSVFVHSRRLIRFLRFVVESALAARSESLKEYVIGVEVFDRTQEFDPRTDPIVRVEARRLRSKIRLYYKGEGRNDQILISFSKGRYEPAFRHRAEHAPRRPIPSKLLLKIGTVYADVRPLIDQAMAERRGVVLPGGGAPDSPSTLVSPLFDDGGRPVGAQISVALEPLLLENGSKPEQEGFALILKQVTDNNSELLAINEQLEDAVERLLAANRESDKARVELDAANSEMNKRYEEVARLNEQAAPRLRHLSRMNDFLEEVVDELQVGIVLLDRQMRVLTINRAAEKIWGIASGEARGESLMALFEHIPVDLLKEPIRDCLRLNVRQELLLPNGSGKVQCRVLPASTNGCPSAANASGILLVMQPA